MKKIIPTLCLALTLGSALTACSDDDAPSLQPTLPASGGDNVASITHLGSVESCYDWAFTYSGGRLTQAVGTVRDVSEDIDGSFQYTSRLSYGNNSVSLNSSNGEEITLTLNSQGYIGQMTVDRNIYNFAYGADGRLASWNKTAFDQSLGQVQQYHSSAVITYSNGALSRITYTGTDNATRTLTFTSSQTANLNGLLPVGVSEELGCIGFEQLYYAGLLGKPAAYLVSSVSYAFDDSTKDYTTNFYYYSTGGNTTLCNYNTPDGAIASVSYAY